MFKNLTPYVITIQSAGNTQKIESSGHAKVVTRSYQASKCLGVECITVPIYGQVIDLPEPDGQTMFIVSLITISALAAMGSTRTDIFAPATGPDDGAIRENGQIVAVTKLVRLNNSYR